MNHRYALLGALSFVLVALTWALWPVQPSDLTAEMYKAQREARASIGSEDDPEARALWEWMRLHDPATGEIPSTIYQQEIAFAQGLPVRDHGSGKQRVSMWTQRGPFNVGGRTRGLIRDVSDVTGNTLLAGGISGGVYRSTDGGASWTFVFGNTNRPSITDIVQDTRAGQTANFYAAVGEFSGNSSGGPGAPYRGHGLYRSTDGGLSWAVIASTQIGSQEAFDGFFDYTSEVVIDPSNLAQQEVYVAAGGNILRSTDGFATFSNVLSRSTTSTGSLSTGAADVLVTSTGTLFAGLHSSGTQRGVFCSTDGTTWTDVSPTFPLSGTNFGRLELGISGDETQLWVVSQNGDLLRRSAANAATLCSGGTWMDFSAARPQRGGSTGTYNTQGGYDMYVTVQPTNNNVVILGGVSLWRLDVGADAASTTNTWIGGYNPATASTNPFAKYPVHHPDQHSFAWHPTNPNEFISGDDGGIQRTDNVNAVGDGSVVWTDLNNGYYTTQFYKTCLNPDDTDDAVAGGLQDNGTWISTAAGAAQSWAEIGSGDGADCGIRTNTGAANSPSRPNGVSRYVSSQTGSVTRNVYDDSDDTVLRDVARVNPVAAGNGQLFITPFVVTDQGNHAMFYPAGTALWRNTNLEEIPLFVEDGVGGAAYNTATVNWTQMTGANVASNIYALEYGGTALFYGAQNAGVYRLDNALTAAAGTAPVTITPSGATGIVSGIAVNAIDENEVLVTYSNYGVVSVWHTTNALAATPTWTNVEGNLTLPSFRDAAIMPQLASGGTGYYVATSIGLYSTETLDGASTVWALEGDIGNVVVDDVDTRPSDGLVVAGTHGRGTYTSTLAVLPVELVAFNATANGSSVELSWETASETNNEGFSIEYSRLGGADHGFTEQAFVKGAGTTLESQQYAFTVDGLSAGRYAFRLRQVDLDGAFEYSPQVEASVSLSQPFLLSTPYPNPVRDRVSLEVAARQNQRVTVSVYDTRGRRVAVIFDDGLEADESVPLTYDASGLAAGVYVVRAVGESFRATQQFTVVR